MSATDGCIAVTFCADIHCAPRVCPNNYSDPLAFPLCHHQVKYLNLWLDCYRAEQLMEMLAKMLHGQV